MLKADLIAFDQRAMTAMFSRRPWQKMSGLPEFGEDTEVQWIRLAGIRANLSNQSIGHSSEGTR